MCVQARTAGRAFRISLRNCAQPNRTPLARGPYKVRVKRFFGLRPGEHLALALIAYKFA